MEKVLKLYKYIDGSNDTPFPNVEYQAVVSDFRYDVKRMGGAPIITCTVMHTLCLDKLWSENVYAYFNGERFFIKQIPTSSYNNTDSRYKHELELVSERFVLDNVYFYDVVDSSENNDKPVSNSSKFSFFGDINEFASRLNQSLQYSNVDYSVVVDDGISSEAKMVSFQDQFFSGAIQEGYNTYNVPFYFEGKVIHFGYTNNAITRTFKYGDKESLLSIQKQNANYKVVNRVTGVGSSDNIPYYYPNDDEKGETEVLYNNKKDIAYVSNQSKYKKVKLSDTFKYSYAKSYNKTLVDEKGRSSNGYLVLVDENVFEIGNVTYPFKIESLSDTMFDINYLGDNLVDIKIDVFRGSEQLMSTSQTGSFSRRYREGNYELRITLHVHIEGVNIESEVNVDDVLKNISLHVYQQTEYKDSWLLNDGEKVNLFDYGLSINGTPSNGDTITFKRVGYIQPQTNLMPSIYRESLGKERFYEALNNAYKIPGSDEYYEFENPYIEGKPKEHIVNFDYIKPTIKGITNSEGLRIDMFIDFAYDENDNDETKIVDGEEVYAHPYFFAKLRKFDGQFGFNLFDHAIDEGEMTISMTSGSCGACNLIVQVNEENKNTVQVDSNGNLKRGDNGDVLFGEPQDRQNDTIHNEVWIALKKDIDTFGVIMPNASKNYRPSTNDTFVILHIDFPKAYILAAEDKLKEELIKYMSLNNSEKFNFSISFSRIFFAENPKILEQLNENARIQIEYDNTTYELYISSYSYSMSKDAPLPEIRIELSDTLTISQNALQTAIGDVKNEILSSIGGSANIDILKQGLRYFLRKDKDDTAKGVLSFDKQIKSSDFVQGDLFGTGWSIYKDSNGNTVVETDRIIARKSIEATELVVNQETFEKGSNIFVKGGCTITKVEIANGRYRCYYNNEEGRRFSGFKVGDQARCQRYNASYGGVIKYYWRLVTGVEEDYVELSMTDCDGTGIPEEGDDIAQLGSRYDKTRQSAIVISPDNGGSVIIWAGIDSFDLSEKNMVGMGVNPNTGRAYLYGYGDMFFGDRSLEKNYITYQTRDGETEPTLNINADIHFGKGSDGLSNLSEFKNIQNEVDNLFGQIEKKSETWYQNTDPSLNWDTTQKNEHKGDLWYNTNEDQTYIWSGTIWIPQGVPDEVFDKIDGKAQIFASRPNSYNKNDLWVLEQDMTLDKDYKKGTIVIAATSSNYFVAAHWTKLDHYTDDSRADEAYGKAEEAYRKAESFSKDLSGVLADMDVVMNQVDREFTIWYYNHVPTLNNAPAVDWDTEEEKQRHDQDICFADELARAWRFVNGQWVEITDERTLAALKISEDAKSDAEDAKKNAEEAKEQATAAANRVANVEYLKDTFGKNETIVDGGVYISKLVSVKNEEENIEAFLNGSDHAKDTVHGKLIMAGGIPDKTSDGLDDLQARSKEATTRIYEDGTVFLGNANISGSFSSGDEKTKFGKDGSGQFANGNIRWDSDGTMWKKSPEYIVWRHLEEEYEDGDTIDLQGGSYLDITAGLDFPEYALPSPETDKTIAIRFIHASRSDVCAVLTGSFYIGGNDVSKVTTEEDSHTFEIEYRKSTGKWHYYGKYEIINDVVYLLDVEKETSQDNRIIEGITESIVIYDLYGAHALGFTSGILTNYKYTPTEG